MCQLRVGVSRTMAVLAAEVQIYLKFELNWFQIFFKLYTKSFKFNALFLI